jgi:hypothetical protein
VDKPDAFLTAPAGPAPGQRKAFGKFSGDRSTSWVRALLLGLAWVLLNACAGPGDDDDADSGADDQSEASQEATSSSPPATTAAPAAATEPHSPSTEADQPLHESGCELVGEGTVRVTPDCVDGEWPLTVPEGEVFCNDGAALLRSTGSGTYPLNGNAMTQFPDLPPLEDIWLVNPSIEGSRIYIGPVSDIAIDLCDF